MTDLDQTIRTKRESFREEALAYHERLCQTVGGRLARVVQI